MKVYLIALLIVVALAGSMAAAAHTYGWHSTPGIRLMLLNLPGTGVAIAIVSRVERIGANDLMLYLICMPVNWVFYFYLIKGAMLLKRKVSS
jgi:hypothetical protein